jgi:hypothetical protein
MRYFITCTPRQIIVMSESRRIKWAGHVARKRSIYRVLVGKTVRKRPLGRHRHKWEDNIEMGIREIRWVVMDRTHLAQVRDQWRVLVHTSMNFCVLYNSVNFLRC